jgi:hypothetical protein
MPAGLLLGFSSSADQLQFSWAPLGRGKTLPGLQLILRQPPSYGFPGNHRWIDEAH